MKKIIRISLAMVFLNVATLNAVEDKHAPKEAHEEHAEHAQHEEHAGHNNHVAVFAGLTTSFGTEASHRFTAGLDYEYRLPILNRLLGLGVLADLAFGDESLHTETSAIFAGFVGIHPFGGLKILVAPGLEAVFHTGTHTETHTEFVLRGSVGYDITLGSISLTPIVSVDYLPTTSAVSLVYGISAGIGF